jgi:hypothetical protein
MLLPSPFVLTICGGQAVWVFSVFRSHERAVGCNNTTAWIEVLLLLSRGRAELQGGRNHMNQPRTVASSRRW